jgi:uncharacterized membrane protein
MNKMLVVIFDKETAAEAGLQALRRLHAEGDISLYATGVMVRDALGVVHVRKALDPGLSGMGTGLAVGSLIGLLGGPLGVAMGAATGTVVGAVRDFWVAGVGLDFVEQADKYLQPGKVALVAEIEEEWVTPVDTALEALGGQVLRRTRSEVSEAQFDHDITAFRSEVHALEAEAAQAGGDVRARLHTRLADARHNVDGAVHRARQRVDLLKQEADTKVDALKVQLSQARDDARARVEARIKTVKGAYHARGAKLAQAWNLAKEALVA